MFRVLFTFFISLNLYASSNVISFMKGKVWVNGLSAIQKQKINFGDEIRTGKSSLAIIKVKPGATLKLKAESKVVIEYPKKSEKLKMQSFILKAGEFFIKASRTENQRFRVRSKNAIFGVRGTQFFVSTVQDNNVWMCVNEGSVAVKTKSSKKAVLVNAGEGVVIDSPKLPIVRQYAWTKNLNWKMQGSYKEVLDTTVIEDTNYKIETFDYD